MTPDKKQILLLREAQNQNMQQQLPKILLRLKHCNFWAKIIQLKMILEAKKQQILGQSFFLIISISNKMYKRWTFTLLKTNFSNNVSIYLLLFRIYLFLSRGTLHFVVFVVGWLLEKNKQCYFRRLPCDQKVLGWFLFKKEPAAIAMKTLGFNWFDTSNKIELKLYFYNLPFSNQLRSKVLTSQRRS